MSAFGFSGTNAHVVLTDADPAARSESPRGGVGTRPLLLAVSGATEPALRAAAARLRSRRWATRGPMTRDRGHLL